MIYLFFLMTNQKVQDLGNRKVACIGHTDFCVHVYFSIAVPQYHVMHEDCKSAKIKGHTKNYTFEEGSNESAYIEILSSNAQTL